jgi:hypothetical protein
VRGVVTRFDEAVGLGEVDDGERRYLFHCTQIADGTRTIPVGAAVSFDPTPARHGQWEATDLRIDI